MIQKEIIFFGQTEAGVFAQALFPSRMEKTARASMDSWDTADEIRKFIRTVSSEDRQKAVYVLVSALGAGEFYGPNINADYFPWESLAHEGDDYGYKTFYNAHAFQHHANKDPERAIGRPVLSVLNPRMKRVELVIRIDREAAKKQGGESIISRIENGEFPDVSMGCKVPYDICSKCGHRSKTRDDYCQHMRPPEELRGVYGPNKILPSGEKIYVINSIPRFFDISFVFIGADKIAKVMAKLASKGSHVCLGNVCALPAEDDHTLLYSATGEPLSIDGLHKVASGGGDERRGPCGKCCASCAERGPCESEKLASAFHVKSAGKKLAEIIKDVPAGVFAMKRLPEMEKREPDISNDDLDAMAERPLASSLGAAARMGIVLKPHEFQRVVLKRMGEDDLISHLDRHHKVFRETPGSDRSLSLDTHDSLDEIFDLLKKYIRERTALGPSFQMRVLMVGRGTKNVLPTRTPIGNSLLDKVSAAYNSYRRGVLEKTSQIVAEVQSDPELTEAVLGDGLSMMFKTASSEILFPDSVKYILGAHLQDRGLLCKSVAGAAIPDDSVFSETIPA